MNTYEPGNPISDQLEGRLSSGEVLRYHAEPTIQQQNVAEHTWGVLVLINYLCPTAEVKLMRAALFHDTEERIIGDIRAPMKRALRNTEAKGPLDRLEDNAREQLGVPEIHLSRYEEHVLKLADYLESLRFVAIEHEMGNQRLKSVAQTLVTYLEKLLEAAIDAKIHNRARCLMESYATRAGVWE